MNIFAQDLKFVTLDEVKNSSEILKVLTDEDIKIFIWRAESIIENLIEMQFTEIPIKIKQATILLANCLFWNKDNSRSKRIIKSETRRWNQVTFATESEDFSLKKIHPCMTPEIYVLLTPYLKNRRWLFFRT